MVERNGRCRRRSDGRIHWQHAYVAGGYNWIAILELGSETADGNLVCRVADEITRDVRLSDDALAAILGRYGTRQALELILNVSHFNMVSRILESTRVEIEADNVLEKNPLPKPG